MCSKLILVSLLGFVCLQAARCDISILPSPPPSSYPSLPSTSLSPTVFYDENGNSIITSKYPYYSFFGYHPPCKLTNDYDFNQKLALYSAIYNVPLSNLYQLDNIIENNMPTIPRDQELDMLQNLAKSIQDEKVRDIINPFQNKLNPSSYPNSLTMAQLMGYLPSDLPPSIAYMQNYLDSLLPTLNPDTLAEIQNAVYSNTPPEWFSKADDLTFQLKTAIRYMLANEMFFVPSY